MLKISVDSVECTVCKGWHALPMLGGLLGEYRQTVIKNVEKQHKDCILAIAEVKEPIQVGTSYD